MPRPQRPLPRQPVYGDQGQATFTIPGLFQARELGQSRWQTADTTLRVAMSALAVRLCELKTLGNRP
ncbi:hypothetical protein [Luethyella okanaganae]|uniref:Uncharacterized protein n=1 Tax=Luethyella okanaganae TaxID=69372 RepID=A0ABW1VFU2_9MICO